MINYSEHLQDVKVAIQATGVSMNQYLERKILLMIRKLKNMLPGAGCMDVYLKHDTHQPPNRKNVTVRLGLPGPDIVVSESGLRWKTMFKSVEKKLIRQLEKRKAAGLRQPQQGNSKFPLPA